ncbi:MAG: STAS domain-containing protein [Acidobacteria bacterium]|nr:STAS domain-containing protein [Acidobacteriota bacterium]
MEITSKREDDFMVVRAKGRLDAYWADHLSEALEEVMRQGHHRIRVNLSEVDYISSMGIRVLVVFYKKLESIAGVFVVSDPSPGIRKVLEMVGLGKTLIADVTTPAAGYAQIERGRELLRENVRFEVFDLGSGGFGLKCGTLGDPGLLEGCRFTRDHCRSLRLPEDLVAVGLGAFGRDYEECKERFGEFLAVAGAAAYQPSDGSNVPDFLLSQGAFVPELQVLYGAVGEGSFASLARFEVKPESRSVGLTELAEAGLEIAGAPQAWMVLIAESAGLVGASLRRPPVEGSSANAPFEHPEVRNWLSFTTERAHTRALAIAVGLISRPGDTPLHPLLRPLDGAHAPAGHFHAAAFSYRPLQRGLIDLKKTVRSLFEHETLLGLLHLIGDDRETVGVSESEFVRGACWIGPITEVSR